MKPNMLTALLVAAPIAISCLCSVAHAFDLQGHRGARGLLPENTLPSFERALRLGVTTLEMDAAVTADGVVIVSHDPVLNGNIVRGPDGKWLDSPVTIRSLTHQQILGFDVGRIRPGSPYARAFPDQQPLDGTRMPRLADVFALTQRLGARDVQFDIETKMDLRNPANTLEPEPFVQALLKVIREAGIDEGRVMIQSFDWRTLQVLRTAAPRVRTVYLSVQNPNFTNVDSPVWTAGFLPRDHGGVPQAVKAAGGHIWSPNYQSLRTDLVRQAQALGLKVVPWTINETADMARIIDMGVDGLITDYPDRAREVMKQRNMPLPPPVTSP